MSSLEVKNNNDSNNLDTRKFVITLCLIALTIFGFYFGNFHGEFSPKNEVWGTFGDYVGGILNPLIAAFAFYLIAESYKLQKRELEETRKLLQVSTDAQKDQIKLAALTALLNSNLARISLLESEKLSLFESELKNPPPKPDINIQKILYDAYSGNYGKYEEHKKTRRQEIQDEIKDLQSRNIALETQIRDFLN